ncbi:MAG TPA: cyanophycinase [Thermoanaerobaculia bacterium]|nr:cyanophycinase [Thermoanaerobaculia bacterium]
MESGLLMAIGGAEDKVRERVILRAFVEAAGGPDANVVVLATASELAETGDRYAAIFESLHADTVEVLRVRSREDALDAGSGVLDLLEFASGLFITGGSQLRISAALGGTAIADKIRRRHAAGMVVAGTSAGAAILSEHMISMGDSGATPRRRLVQMGKGLGLAPELVIDQHFRQRDRLGRLVTALSYNPDPLGIGVDEDTAAVIHDGELRVIGSGAVTVLDASGVRYTDCSEVRRGQALSMLGLKLDFLTSGCRYDLRRRVGLPPLAGKPSLEQEEVANLSYSLSPGPGERGDGIK